MLNRLDWLMKEIGGNGCIATGTHASGARYTRDDVVGMARRVLTARSTISTYVALGSPAMDQEPAMRSSHSVMRACSAALSTVTSERFARRATAAEVVPPRGITGTSEMIACFTAP